LGAGQQQILDSTVTVTALLSFCAYKLAPVKAITQSAILERQKKAFHGALFIRPVLISAAKCGKIIADATLTV
jgi:hypothetical protein